jgi:hypothetical protein
MIKGVPPRRGRGPRRKAEEAPAEAPPVESVPLNQDVVYLRAVCDFSDRTDKARFYYSLDGNQWTAIGDELQMSYTLPHFMGYRLGLFNYATQEAGGHADFDDFQISDRSKLPAISP